MSSAISRTLSGGKLTAPGKCPCSYAPGARVSIRVKSSFLSIFLFNSSRLIVCINAPCSWDVLRSREVTTRCASLLRFEDQLLHAPVQQLSDVQFIFRGARNFVNPTELLELLAR